MKPGDTVTIRQPDGFVTLFAYPGPASPVAGPDAANPEVLHMEPNHVGLVVGVTEVEAEGCTYTECLVMVATPDGGAKYGWRETDRFDVITETELARRRIRSTFQARDDT